MKNNDAFSRERLTRAFFFLSFAFVLYQLFLLFRPFMPGLLGAAFLALAFHPLHERLRRVIKDSNSSSLAMTTAVVLLAVIPLCGIAWFFFRESERFFPFIQGLVDWAQSMDFSSVFDRLPTAIQNGIERLRHLLSGFGMDPKPIVLENMQRFGARLAFWGSTVATNIFPALFNIVVLVIGLFFWFRDGQSLVHWAVSLIPMETAHKELLARRAYETFRAVTIGVFATATAQGLTAMLGFWIAGVKLPVLLGVLTGMTSLLGASVLVTLPVSLFVFQQSTGWGVFLLLWSLVLVGFMDNILKPLLIGSRTRMPFILIFFSILGGIKMYGFLGFIMGPVLVASFLTFVKIYREAYSL
jgi:predicted PurR-regulated permease PerM